jgi:hypothetical protein
MQSLFAANLMDGWVYALIITVLFLIGMLLIICIRKYRKKPIG